VGVRTHWLPVVLTAVSAAACRGTPERLATVGDRTITLSQLAGFVSAQTGRSLAEVSPELAGAMFDRYLEEEVLLAASSSPADRDLAPNARDARVRELVSSLCPPPPSPTDTQVNAYVAAHAELANAGERLRLRQLVLPDQATARAIRDRARAGEDFVALSREASRAPNAANGGVLGWVERGQLPPEFEAAVFGLAPGELSEPVPSNAGWHVFQVVERRAGGGGPDADLRERVRAQLAARSTEVARQACLRELAGRIGVRVDCAGASFPCRNPFEGAS
jgi:parvulin-like peptidyl-prolyl isomerase